MRKENSVNRNAFHLLLSWTIILVTLTAVSVVIWTGPSRRPSKPFLRSSEVLSDARRQLYA